MGFFITFLLVTVAIYAALHVYVYRKVVTAFRPRRLPRLLLAVVFAVMIAAPFLGRTLDHDGHPGLARLVNLPAYLWLAWVFWFCMLGFALDAWNGLLRWVGRKVPACGAYTLSPRYQAPLLFIIVVMLSIWGLVEATLPRIREIPLHHPALAGHETPLRLIHVSDIHVSPLRSGVWNRLLCAKIRKLRPDVIVNTGDMVDSSMRNIGERTEPWAGLQPPLGKYAVLGNHEYYTGPAESMAFLDQAGFRVLRGEWLDVGESLRLVGVDDTAGLHQGLPCAWDERLATRAEPGPGAAPAGGPRYTILLKHQPRVRAPELFQLQLSGHTHGGQLFPFNVFVRLFYPHGPGLHTLVTGSHLYVNRGAGTFGPPLRLFAPPEITLFLLQP